MPEQINYLELPAKDLEKAQSFFSELFQWTFVQYGPDYLAFNDTFIEGGFYRSDLSSNAANGATLIVFLSDDLEATLERVVQCGGVISTPVFDFPGGRRFHFLDPNENEYAVWTKVDG